MFEPIMLFFRTYSDIRSRSITFVLKYVLQRLILNLTIQGGECLLYLKMLLISFICYHTKLLHLYCIILLSCYAQYLYLETVVLTSVCLFYIVFLFLLFVCLFFWQVSCPAVCTKEFVDLRNDMYVCKRFTWHILWANIKWW
jgi:hypothetical protein